MDSCGLDGVRWIGMAEKTIFDSKFHKWYVGGEGEVRETQEHFKPKNVVIPRSYHELLAEYRMYVGDATAELPEEVLAQLQKSGRVEADL